MTMLTWLRRVNLSVKTRIVVAGVALFFIVGIFTLPKVFATTETETVPTTERLVTIYDRKQKKVVLTDRFTVAEVLAQAEIAVAPGDVVEPSLETKLVSEKFNINIFRARPVMLIDGASRLRVVTPHTTPDLVARAAGVTLYPEDRVHTVMNFLATGGETGLSYVITRAKLVNFIYYGKLTQVRTQGKVVADLLAEKGLKLEANDHLNLEQNTPIGEGMTLELWREGRQEVAEEEEIAFSVRKIYDYNREPSYRQVERTGVVGRRLVNYEINIKNGEEVARRELSSIIITEPVEQIEVVGAKGRYNTPSENENITWHFLINQGFSRVQTAGIMGNLMQEHKFLTSDTAGGLGIAQWTGARRKALMQTYPNSWDTIGAQLEFLMSELNSKYSHVKQEIMATEDLAKVVEIFQNQFERCNPRYCMFNRRLEYATNILASH